MTKLILHGDIYKSSRNDVRNVVFQAKAKYYRSKIEVCKQNQRTVFSVVNKVLHKTTDIFPNNLSKNDLPNEFRKCFIDNIVKIRELLSSHDTHLLNANEIDEPTLTGDACMTQFTILTAGLVKDIISSSSNAFCELDPLPTCILKQHSNILIPSITNIINTSLSIGIFPTTMKTARVRPLIKKSSLDQNILKNYRPVSNLSFLSKLIEKAVSLQLKDHLCRHGLNEVFQ